MSTYQSLDLRRRSATTEPPPNVRQTAVEVAKLIDVSKCIGCKACQVACLEWNNLREEIGVNTGVYENPHDLTEHTWTLMRYTERFNEDGNLEWLIRKDGCMHCDDPGCLKACPAPGAIVQYRNGIVDFISENCIGCGYCIKGCPFNIPRISRVDNTAYKCTLCSDRVAVGQGPACAKACPTDSIQFGELDELRERAAARVATLHERGETSARLYGADPDDGVGGDGAFFLLLDDPEVYGLPPDPVVTTRDLPSMWRHVGAAAVTLAAGVLFSFAGRRR